jgi:hypothetical protein
MHYYVKEIKRKKNVHTAKAVGRVHNPRSS